MKRLKIVLLSALLTVTVGAFAGWSGSGSFTRTHDWTDDAAAGIPITASRMDAEDDNFATGINACLAKNGENAATSDLNIGGYRLTSVAAGSAATDAATIGGAETLTNKTLTAPVLGGTVTGTYTLGGTPTLDLSSVTTSGDLPVASGGSGASSFTAYGVVTGGTTTTGALQSISTGTTGQILQSAGASAVPVFTDRNISMGQVTPTAVTYVDFTGIPSWVRRITVVCNGISTDGASQFKLLLGDSGGLATTGYFATYGYYSSSAQSASSSTTGFVATRGPAANTSSQIWTLINITANQWVVSMTGDDSGGSIIHSAGAKTLTGTLTQLRYTTVGGTDTFDNGTINVFYE